MWKDLSLNAKHMEVTGNTAPEVSLGVSQTGYTGTNGNQPIIQLIPP